MAMVQRVPLSRSRVLTAAVELVDGNGVDALSMRKLGAALGVEAMSLYNHVENKDDVLDGILDLVIAEIELPAADLPWADQLRAIAHSFRRVGHVHPRIFPLFGSRAIRSVEGFQPFERSYAVLRSAGLDPGDALDAFISLASYVFGYVLVELGGLVDVAEGRALAVGQVNGDAHPWLAEMGATLPLRDGDRQFEFGLEQLLHGLAEMVARARC